MKFNPFMPLGIEVIGSIPCHDQRQSLHSKTSVYIPLNGITALSKVMVIKGRSKQVGSSEPSAP